jgi:glutamine cyclotransferase
MMGELWPHRLLTTDRTSARKRIPEVSRFVILFLLIGCCPLLMGQTSRQVSATAPPEYSFASVRVFPHDTSAYTQGLAYRDGFLYEGTGRNGQSSLRKVRLETGEVIQRVDLGSEFFGEGITIIKDRVVQLTWKSGLAFVYDLKSFHPLRKAEYSGEGWGLAIAQSVFPIGCAGMEN